MERKEEEEERGGGEGEGRGRRRRGEGEKKEECAKPDDELYSACAQLVGRVQVSEHQKVAHGLDAQRVAQRLLAKQLQPVQGVLSKEERVVRDAGYGARCGLW